MNGSPQLPQYTFDPATQQYRLKTPAEQAQEQQKGKSGLGGLYEATGGGDSMGPQGPVGFGMMDPGRAEMGVALQNIGQFAANNPVMAAFSPVTSAVTSIAGNIGNSMMGSQVSPVANPTPATVTAIAPDPAFSGLAAMNAQQAAETEANEAAAAQSAAVGEAASAAAASVGEGPGTGNDAGVGDAAGDAGGGGGGGDAGGGGDGAGDGGGNAAGSAGVGDGEREGGMIRRKNYKEGGIASLAEKVESKGRGDDKMLVHMTPGEVAGLQYLAMQHGGSLTINPDTGLPEAGFLSNILPMVAGAALTIGSGGTLTPLMAAGLVGGGTALMTGSLEKGLFAGLGAFGGAGLGTALTAPAVTGTQAGLQAVGQQALGAPAAAAAGGGAQASALMQQNIAMGMTPAEAAAQIAGSASYAPAAAANIPSSIANPTFFDSTLTNARVGLGNLKTGVSNVFDFSSPQGTKAREALIGQAADKKTGQEATGLGGTMGALKTVGLAAAPFAGSMFSAEEPDEGGKKPQEYIRPYSFDFKPSAEVDPNFKFRTGERGESTAEQRYFTPTFTPMGVFKAGTEPGPSFYGTPTEDLYKLYSGPKQLAAGGIAGLKKGRFLDDKTDSTGNSDGMSDSLPAVINGEQPARLTDGEFVVPADVVSHLGNGSSKAGAKRLHNMMDRIRAARTGTKKQAPEVKAEKFMPA